HHVQGVPSRARRDAQRARHPGDVADAAIGTNGNRTAGPGGDVTGNIGVADADSRVGDLIVGNDIAAVFSFERRVVSVGAVIWIRGIEAVRGDAITFQIDVPEGSHADVEQGVDFCLDDD